MKRLSISILICSIFVSLLVGCSSKQDLESKHYKSITLGTNPTHTDNAPAASVTTNNPQGNPSPDNIPQDVPDHNDTTLLAQKITKITYSFHDDGTTYSVVEAFEYDSSRGIRSHKQTINGVLFKDYTYDGSLDRPLSLAECWIDENNNERWNIQEFSYKYDKNGNIIERIDPYSCTKYEYDDHGNIIRLESNDNCYEYAYTYQDGKIVEEIRYCNGKEISNSSYQYNRDGNLSESIRRDDEGVSKSVYRYDANGNETDYMNYTNDELTFQESRSYDSNNNLITETNKRYGDMEDYSHSFRYEYNNDNLLVRQTVFNHRGYVLDEIEYKYDGAGNRIETIFRNDDGSITRHDKYTRDENGFMANFELSYDGELIVSAKFEYECVPSSEEQITELAEVLDQWAYDTFGGFEYEWNY
ncbi:MAG: hypothetical protein E7466_06560 [Ruminococcaceae bacterium]|nr:hypothetical protein [Oscillospiraceae bacterium]